MMRYSNCSHDKIEDKDFFKGCEGLLKIGLIKKGKRDSYQWGYEFSFWKNPTILVKIGKALTISLLFPVSLMFFISIGKGILEALRLSIAIFGYGIFTIAILLLITYPIAAMINGGKYYVLFKVDNNGINHIQLDKKYKKPQVSIFLNILIGLSGNNITSGGADFVAAIRQSLYTNFNKVKSVKISRSRNTIYLNEAIKHNQIYVENEDFDFVLNHILKNCPKDIKVLGKT